MHKPGWQENRRGKRKDRGRRRPRSLSVSGLPVYQGSLPVIVMYGPLKPANDTVYVKLESVMPPGIVGVQFGLGHVCCARNCCSVGAVTESEGTVSLPFFGESWPEVVEAVKVPWCCELDGFPPPLIQTTVAEYVALKSARAFVLPTPASSNELQLTVRPETEQLGVPVWT